MERLGCTTQIRDGGLPSRRREFIHSLFEPLRRQMTTTSPVIEREPGSFDRRLNDRRRALSRLLRSTGYCLLRTVYTLEGTIRGPIEVYFIWGRMEGGGQKIKRAPLFVSMKRTMRDSIRGEGIMKEKKKKKEEKFESSYSNCVLEPLAHERNGDRKIRSNK